MICVLNIAAAIHPILFSDIDSLLNSCCDFVEVDCIYDWAYYYQSNRSGRKDEPTQYVQQATIPIVNTLKKRILGILAWLNDMVNKGYPDANTSTLYAAGTRLMKR
jgi:hypothetical protein